MITVDVDDNVISAAGAQGPLSRQQAALTSALAFLTFFFARLILAGLWVFLAFFSAAFARWSFFSAALHAAVGP